MARKEITVCLSKACDKFQDELDGVNSERREIVEEYRSYEDSEDAPKSLKKRWEKLEAQRVTLNRKISRFEDEIESLDETEFVIRELSFGQVQAVQDIVSEESFDVDIESQSIDGTPLQGVFRSEFMSRAVVSKPDGIGDIMDLPDVIGEWLWDRVDAFNTSGEEDMGNMSLEEASKREEI